MQSGRDSYDNTLLDSLEKKYQLFLDSPNGEINVYLVLNKHEEDKYDNSGINHSKNSPFSANVLQPSREKNSQATNDII